MKLTEIYKEMLTEENHKLEFGCAMLMLPINKDSWKKLLDEISPDDLYGTKEEGFNVETEPHITLLFGLHKNVSDEDVQEIVKKMKPINISMKTITCFENDDYDVLKFDVKSSDLKKYHDLLAELPHTDTYSEYKPHSTIAYLNKGKAKKYIGHLNHSFKCQCFDIEYSKPEDSKKMFKIN